jgi:hypothetical protein
MNNSGLDSKFQCIGNPPEGKACLQMIQLEIRKNGVHCENRVPLIDRQDFNVAVKDQNSRMEYDYSKNEYFSARISLALWWKYAYIIRSRNKNHIIMREPWI